MDCVSICAAKLIKSSIDIAQIHSCWVGADTIFLNPNILFEAFLPTLDPAFDSIHVLSSQDSWGSNCGVFFTRDHNWNVRLLMNVSTTSPLRLNSNSTVS